MTNSLKLGCDCKGYIRYLDAEFPAQDGTIRYIKNAICIHEEDNGLLFKHTDFRDDSTIITRARKLIIQQIFTAANYEYAIQVCNHTKCLCHFEVSSDQSESQWIFHVTKPPSGNIL